MIIEIGSYFIKKAHHIAFDGVGPLIFENLFHLVILEDVVEAGSEFFVEFGDIPFVGDEEEEFYFVVLHLSIFDPVDGELFKSIGLKFLDGTGSRFAVLVDVAILAQLLFEEVIPSYVHLKYVKFRETIS